MICQVDYEDKTPLHFAAANGNGDVVKLLVDNKADVSLQVSYRVAAHPIKIANFLCIWNLNGYCVDYKALIKRCHDLHYIY